MTKSPIQSNLQEFIRIEVSKIYDGNPDLLTEYIMKLVEKQKQNETLTKDALINSLSEYFDNRTGSFIDCLLTRLHNLPEKNNYIKKRRVDSEDGGSFKYSRLDEYGKSSIKCRDFHEKKFCMNGDMCHYDHRVIENTLEIIPTYETTLEYEDYDYFDDNTLKVEKIPTVDCRLSTIHRHFSKFGVIIDIKMNYDARIAIIRYSTHKEAVRAYNSPEAIFNNRFVKVFWVNQDIKNNESEPEIHASKISKSESKQTKRQEQMKQLLLEIQKKREIQLQQQIDEQKKLLMKLSSQKSKSSTTKALMAIKQIPTHISLINNSESAATNNKNVLENKQELKKKLAKLEAEISNLGIHKFDNHQRSRSVSKMSIDNRPKKIIVKQIPQECTKDELRKHFEQYGHVNRFEQQGAEIVIEYRYRYEAEKAMAFGSPLPSKEKLELNWIE